MLISKGHILSDFYITLSKWQNYRSGKQISGCQGLEMVRGKVVGVTIKGHHERGLCGDGILMYLDYGSSYMNLYLW